MDSLIRLAEAGDLAYLQFFMAEFYAESGYPFNLDSASGALLELIDDSKLGRLWLIQSSQKPVGYIAVTFGFSLEFHGRDAFIDEFFVQAACRGAGLGTRVLKTIEIECQALGIQALHLEVERVNSVGHELYRKHGFRDHDRYLLSKRIASVSES